MSLFNRLKAILGAGAVSSIERYENDVTFSPDEVGFTHPVTGACIKFRDEGEVDLFAGDMVGIRLDPKTGAIHILGNDIEFDCSTVNFRTPDAGLMWNGTPLERNLLTGNFIINAAGELLRDIANFVTGNSNTPEPEQAVPADTFAQDINEQYSNGTTEEDKILNTIQRRSRMR